MGTETHKNFACGNTAQSNYRSLWMHCLCSSSEFPANHLEEFGRMNKVGRMHVAKSEAYRVNRPWRILVADTNALPDHWNETLSGYPTTRLVVLRLDHGSPNVALQT